MKVFTFHGGLYAANCYLVTDEKGENGVLVDPSVPPETVRACHGGLPHIEALLLTHAHFDHMLYLEEWRRETEAPLALMWEDSFALGDAGLNCYRMFLRKETTFRPAERLLADGDTVPVGQEALRVLALPGHTPGSAAFVGDGFILTGDTVFADGGVGRWDLPGGSETALRASLQRFFSLEGEYTLYPGHGAPALFSTEKKFTRL